MMKNAKFLFSLVLVLLLSQCKNRQKDSFQQVQKQTKERTNIDAQWNPLCPLPEIDVAVDKGLTLQNAIVLGINYNSGLQAHFEEIGIRQSDLIQVGFYSNPQLEALFRIPHQGDDVQSDIEINAKFLLSDLWQVPLRKKVSQDSLEIKTYEIVNEILELRRTIQQKYLHCLYNEEYLKLVKEITMVIQNIKKRTDYRYQFGYVSDLDRYFVASKLGEWYAKIIEAEANLHASYVELHEIIGSIVSSKTINLLHSAKVMHLNISQEVFKNFACISHPLILIEETKVNRAEHSIRYEKSRIIDGVRLGIAYERDFEKSVAGVGPFFGIDVPIFNTNYGNIERAKFEKKQAEKKLYEQKRMVLRDISTRYIQYQSLVKQIEFYNRAVIPPVLKAIEFSKTFFNRMQMNLIVFLNTQIDLFHAKEMLLDLTFKAINEYSKLELAVGSQIKNIDLHRNHK